MLIISQKIAVTKIDKFLNQVNQRYAYNSIVQMSEREGFQLAQSENPQNGSLRLLLRKFN